MSKIHNFRSKAIRGGLSLVPKRGPQTWSPNVVPKRGLQMWSPKEPKCMFEVDVHVS